MSYITIADMFIQSIEKYADNPAFFDKINGEWQGKTYKDAGEIVENLASGLASLGVQKEDKIAILSPIHPNGHMLIMLLQGWEQ